MLLLGSGNESFSPSLSSYAPVFLYHNRPSCPPIYRMYVSCLPYMKQNTVPVQYNNTSYENKGGGHI